MASNSNLDLRNLGQHPLKLSLGSARLSLFFGRENKKRINESARPRAIDKQQRLFLIELINTTETTQLGSKAKAWWQACRQVQGQGSCSSGARLRSRIWQVVCFLFLALSSLKTNNLSWRTDGRPSMDWRIDWSIGSGFASNALFMSHSLTI